MSPYLMLHVWLERYTVGILWHQGCPFPVSMSPSWMTFSQQSWGWGNWMLLVLVCLSSYCFFSWSVSTFDVEFRVQRILCGKGLPSVSVRMTWGNSPATLGRTIIFPFQSGCSFVGLIVLDISIVESLGSELTCSWYLSWLISLHACVCVGISTLPYYLPYDSSGLSWYGVVDFYCIRQ